jgi:hypothetical protein
MTSKGEGTKKDGIKTNSSFYTSRPEKRKLRS